MQNPASFNFSFPRKYKFFEIPLLNYRLQENNVIIILISYTLVGWSAIAAAISWSLA